MQFVWLFQMEGSGGIVFGSPPLHRRFTRNANPATHLKTSADTLDFISNSNVALHDGLNKTSYSPYPPASQPTYERYRAETDSSSSTDNTESHRQGFAHICVVFR
jgi:hypothetical protein